MSDHRPSLWLPASFLHERDDKQRALDDERRRARIAYQRGHAAYSARHAACPSCGSDEVERTCMGAVSPDWETHVDHNRAACHGHDCRWTGTIHDLVPYVAPPEPDVATIFVALAACPDLPAGTRLAREDRAPWQQRGPSSVVAYLRGRGVTVRYRRDRRGRPMQQFQVDGLGPTAFHSDTAALVADVQARLRKVR